MPEHFPYCGVISGFPPQQCTAIPAQTLPQQCFKALKPACPPFIACASRLRIAPNTQAGRARSSSFMSNKIRPLCWLRLKRQRR